MPRSWMVNFYYKTLTRLLRTIQWLLGASTVGVRTLVINQTNQVLLIRHTYMGGWHFPGGGVLPGEPTRLAAVRELYEETCLQAEGDIELLGVYFHTVMKVNDYIALYVVKNFSQAEFCPSPEIAEVQWFDFDNLPPNINSSTKQRLTEYLHNQPRSDFW